MKSVKYFLVKIMSVITRHDRYMPVIEWSKESWTHNVFRVWELIFGRRYGIRIESSSDSIYGLSTMKFYTLESFLVYQEDKLRKAVKQKFVFNPLYLAVIMDILGLRKEYAYNWGKDAHGYYFAIAHDAASGGSVGSGQSVTFGQVCSGSDRILWVGVASASSRTVSGITFPLSATPTALTPLTRSAGSNPSQLWYLINPDTGASNNVVVSIGAPNTFIGATSSSYSGAKQSAQPDSQNVANGTGTPLSTSTTVVDSNCWLILVVRNDTSGSTSASTGATLRQDTTGYNQLYDSAGTVGTGSQSMSIDVLSGGGAGDTTRAIASFAPAGASTTIKTWNGIVRANLKTLNGTASASIKTINGIT